MLREIDWLCVGVLTTVEQPMVIGEVECVLANPLVIGDERNRRVLVPLGRLRVNVWVLNVAFIAVIDFCALWILVRFEKIVISG